MFVGSAVSQSFPEAQPSACFLRDVIASLATLGALGALLVTIQAHSAKPARAPLKTPAVASTAEHAAAPGSQARQPSDVSATPKGDEEDVARAMVAFALSKVSPLQPEPVASISSTRMVAHSRAVKKLRQIASPQPAPGKTAGRTPAPAVAGFRPAEWPKSAPSVEVAATPADQAAVRMASRFSWRQIEVNRLIPGSGAITTSAANLASGARKTIGHSMAGIRSGAAAVQESAVSVASRLW